MKKIIWTDLVRNEDVLVSCDLRPERRVKRHKPTDATNPMFIIKLLSQHVSGIVIPIFRRTRSCITAYGVLHCLCWLWLCGAGMRAVCTA